MVLKTLTWRISVSSVRISQTNSGTGRVLFVTFMRIQGFGPFLREQKQKEKRNKEKKTYKLRMNENKLLKLNVTHLPLENNPFSLKIYKLFIIYFVFF